MHPEMLLLSSLLEGVGRKACKRTPGNEAEITFSAWGRVKKYRERSSKLFPSGTYDKTGDELD